MTYKVLFVCLGNTCRSPALADMMNNQAKGLLNKKEILASSAAITKYNIGNPIDPLMKQVAAERGIKFKKHKARMLTKEIIAEQDLIFGVTEDICEMIRAQCSESQDKKKVFLATHFSLTYLNRDIIDPFSKDKKQYSDVFRQLETIVTETLENKLFYKLSKIVQPE